MQGRDFFPAVAGFEAAQGQDAGGAGYRPSHSGQFAALRDDGFAPGLDCSRADEHAQLLEVGVAHPVGIALEVAQRGVQVCGLLPGQGEGACGGADRGNIAVVQVGKPLFKPGLLVVAEHELQQPGQVVQVLPGMEQVHDLGRLGEVPGGQVPDPDGSVTEEHQLADAPGAAAAGLGGHQHAEVRGGIEGDQVRRRTRVTHRPALLIGCRLSENTAQLDLAGAGRAVRGLAVPALGLGRDHRHAGTVDADVQHVRGRPGRRYGDDLAGCDRGGPGFDHGGGSPAVGLGSAAGPLAGQADPGQLAHQLRRGVEGDRGGSPVGHPGQPRRHGAPGHPQPGVARCEPVPAFRAVIPRPAQRDRTEHGVNGLVPAGHELRLVALAAGHARAAVARIGGQQRLQHLPPQFHDRSADR